VEQGHGQGQGQGQHIAIEPNVISVADAARMLNMSMGTIRYRIKQGKYNAVKAMTPTGETYMINRADFLRAHPECANTTDVDAFDAERINAVAPGAPQTAPSFVGGASDADGPPVIDAEMPRPRSNGVTATRDDQQAAFMALLGHGLREAIAPVAAHMDNAHALVRDATVSQERVTLAAMASVDQSNAALRDAEARAAQQTERAIRAEADAATLRAHLTQIECEARQRETHPARRLVRAMGF